MQKQNWNEWLWDADTTRPLMLPHEKPVTSKAGWEPQTDEAAEQHKN